MYIAYVIERQYCQRILEGEIEMEKQKQNQYQNKYNVVAIWSDSDNRSVVLANVSHDDAMKCCRDFYVQNSNSKLSYCIEEA